MEENDGHQIENDLRRRDKLEKNSLSERERSFEEGGRKSRSLEKVNNYERSEMDKWREEALAKTNFSPMAFLVEEMEVEEELDQRGEEGRKRRRVLDRKRRMEREEKREKRLKTEKSRFRDDFRRHFEDRRDGRKVEEDGRSRKTYGRERENEERKRRQKRP